MMISRCNIISVLSKQRKTYLIMLETSDISQRTIVVTAHGRELHGTMSLLAAQTICSIGRNNCVATLLRMLRTRITWSLSCKRETFGKHYTSHLAILPIVCHLPPHSLYRKLQNGTILDSTDLYSNSCHVHHVDRFFSLLCVGL